MRTKIDTVGVGVSDEGGFKDGRDDSANCMMNYSIAVGCSGDHSRFGGFDFKGVVGAGVISLGLELIL